MRWNRRRRARRLLVQALYQQQLTGYAAEEIESQFSGQPHYLEADPKFFSSMLHEAIRRRDDLDRDIAAASDISPDRIDPVEKAILWSALTEMQNGKAENAVVINEAIELAREFGAEKGYRFVNAVLDRWARGNPEGSAAGSAGNGD